MKVSSITAFTTQDVELQSPHQTYENHALKIRPLTTLELCDFLQASKTVIDQYNREGMPRFFVGKQCRYIPEKVLHWLERRMNKRVRPQIGVLAQD